MFCKNCGKEIDDNAYVCPNCGVKVAKEEPVYVANNDTGAKVGWGILSYLIPLVGLILFCVWRSERPAVAKVCGICALVSFILNIILTIILYVAVIAAAVAVAAL